MLGFFKVFATPYIENGSKRTNLLTEMSAFDILEVNGMRLFHCLGTFQAISRKIRTVLLGGIFGKELYGFCLHYYIK